MIFAPILLRRPRISLQLAIGNHTAAEREPALAQYLHDKIFIYMNMFVIPEGCQEVPLSV